MVIVVIRILVQMTERINVLADVLNYVLSSRKQVGQLSREIKTESDQLDTKKYFIWVKGP